MHSSPPIIVLAILAVGVASTAWLSPRQSEASHVNVMLPVDTYETFAQFGKEYTDADGRPLTVAQVIEEFADIYEMDSELPEVQM